MFYCLQAKEDGDKPGLVAILQKVLQLYASHILSARSYAIKGEQGSQMMFREACFWMPYLNL